MAETLFEIEKFTRPLGFNGLCPQCQSEYRNTGHGYASCPNGHGKLIRKLTRYERIKYPKLRQSERLRQIYPVAEWASGKRRKRWRLDGLGGLWIQTTDDTATAAVVFTRGYWQVRRFRQVK